MVKQTAGRDQLGDFASKSQGLVDSSFQYHLMSAKNNGITKEEIAEILDENISTVKSRLYRSMKKLRSALGNDA